MKKKTIKIFSGGFPVKTITIGPLDNSEQAAMIIAGFVQNSAVDNLGTILIEAVRDTESDSDVEEEEKGTYQKFNNLFVDLRSTLSRLEKLYAYHGDIQYCEVINRILDQIESINQDTLNAKVYTS